MAGFPEQRETKQTCQSVSRPLSQRPCWREAALWSIPAILAGVFLRYVLLHYNPYAYWSEDSASYIRFARMLFEDGEFDLERKRRWL